MIQNNIEIREIKYHSEEYSKEQELRDNVLRKPLGMSLYDENMDAEQQDVHIGAFLNNRIVGVLILTRLNAEDVKMRQVAVDEKLRNQHIGRKMVLYAEKYATESGYINMLLNARKTAVGFYGKLGYEKISEAFLEINIPHYKMCKRLTVQSDLLTR